MPQVTVGDLRPYVERTGGHQWEINFDGAECWFEMPDDEVGIVSHLFVPETERGRGIGSVMVRLAIQTLENEGVSEVHSQIQAADGATEHVLSGAGFDTATFEKDGRTIVDGVLVVGDDN